MEDADALINWHVFSFFLFLFVFNKCVFFYLEGESDFIHTDPQKVQREVKKMNMFTG